MSAEVLRKAAALMRERAEAASDGEWQQVTREGVGIAPSPFSSATIATTHSSSGLSQSAADAAHIASWHPAVALAVADQLDWSAGLVIEAGAGPLAVVAAGLVEKSIDIARAYLGESA